MENQQKVLDKLESFKKKHKFSTSEWNKRGLNPSNTETCDRLEQLFNDCTSNLISAVNSNATKRQLRKILKSGLSNFNKR